MVHQINPGLARLYSENLTRQYGYKSPTVLADLTDGQHRVLDLLELGISDSQLTLLPKMANAKEAEVGDLLSRLGGVLRQTKSHFPELSDEHVQSRFKEILRLFASTSADPIEALKARGRARVFINELSPFGLLLARGLAAAGVGTILSDDQVRVSLKDLGPLGFSSADLGKPRVTAARDDLAGQIAIQHHSRVTSGYDSVDFALLSATDVLNPRVYQRWLSRDIPHLLIKFDEAGVEISHLVVPGITPCLGCLDFAKAKSSNQWHVIATQLDYLERDFSDSASSLFGASIALSRILNRIDLPFPRAELFALRLDRSSGVTQLQIEGTNCGCHQMEMNSEGPRSSE